MSERQAGMPASEDEDRAPEQTWGQGVGRHEPTIPDDDEEPTSYAGGEPHELDDPDLPLSRETEGMDR
ncbi:MAG TPA: hypothetical protein VFN76_02395 [Candidatus Limnocylindria bacterium]|nr:hypothetical protein [Candidatus Limnocylindria bacterium]